MAQIVSARMCVVSWIQLLPAQGGTMTGGPEEPKLIRVVGAAIVKDGKVLCAQRGSGKTLSGYWEFPGGKIEEGRRRSRLFNGRSKRSSFAKSTLIRKYVRAIISMISGMWSSPHSYAISLRARPS